MKRILLIWFVPVVLAQVLNAATAPTIVGISTPYPLLQLPVQFGGVHYAPGSVAYGAVGTPITIRGANFGSSGVVVFLGTQQTTTMTVPYTSSDGANIAISIPVGATTGTLVVTAEGDSNAVPILVTYGSSTATCSVNPQGPPAVITGLTPSTGPQGTLITIIGQRFGTSPGTVVIGGIPATIVSWKPNSIIAWVPSAVSANTLAPVLIFGIDGQSSNAVGFSVTGSSVTNPSCQLTQ